MLCPLYNFGVANGAGLAKVRFLFNGLKSGDLGYPKI